MCGSVLVNKRQSGGAGGGAKKNQNHRHEGEQIVSLKFKTKANGNAEESESVCVFMCVDEPIQMLRDVFTRLMLIMTHTSKSLAIAFVM